MNTSKDGMMQYLTSCGFTKEFGYVKTSNEFLFETFDSIENKVDLPLVLSIFKLKDEEMEYDAQPIFSANEYQGQPIFERIEKNSNDEEEKEPESKEMKVYYVELTGYWHMVDLDAFGEELYNFSKNFEPYIYFRKATKN